MIELLDTRPTTKLQLSDALQPRHEFLYDLEWHVRGVGPRDNHARRWAWLGHAPSDFLQTLAGVGIAVDVYANAKEVIAASMQNGSAPDALIMAYLDGANEDVIAAAHADTSTFLNNFQELLAEACLNQCSILVLTRRAIATQTIEDILDLGHAPLWGLVRAACVELPERTIMLGDIDDSDASRGVLPKVLSLGEPQFALRDGLLRIPRFTRAKIMSESLPRGFSSSGTVLITGGTGTLGAHVARHLVAKHGVRHVLLISRQGSTAPGASVLQHELEMSGAHVTIAAADVTDLESLKQLIAAIPDDHPLTGVIHAAGILDDGVLDTLTATRISRVFRPKVDAAMHLHELTKDLQVPVFVLFSSLAGILGSAGQSNYAAANSFLDALAQHRRAHGLSAVSLAWGFWSEESNMSAHLTSADHARRLRAGIGALSTAEGLALFDVALERPEANLAPFRLLPANLQTMPIPPLLREIVRIAPSRLALADKKAPSPLDQRLRAIPERDRERTLFDLLRAEIATVLGHSSPQSIDKDRSLRELGLDSLMALE
ncbi:MAG TPA: beta-ketoacyl reductase, partial [Polyangium sp.]|nr:beta-ketoacyl reductase [Polyangium sp.]